MERFIWLYSGATAGWWCYDDNDNIAINKMYLEYCKNQSKYKKEVKKKKNTEKLIKIETKNKFEETTDLVDFCENSQTTTNTQTDKSYSNTLFKNDDDIIKKTCNCNQISKICNCNQISKICNCNQISKICSCNQISKICSCNQISKICSCNQILPICNCNQISKICSCNQILPICNCNQISKICSCNQILPICNCNQISKICNCNQISKICNCIDSNDKINTINIGGSFYKIDFDRMLQINFEDIKKRRCIMCLTISEKIFNNPYTLKKFLIEHKVKGVAGKLF